jgi:uncharacterized protein YjbI with pentapeptide repeats
MGMRRTTAPLPVDHQHRHSQPISAEKATSSTIKVSNGTVMVVLHRPGRCTSASRRPVARPTHPREPVADDAAGFRFQMATCALLQRSLTDCFRSNASDCRGEAMANEEQVKRLKHGVRKWNKWRDATRPTLVDLSNANLESANLSGANLNNADLIGAYLSNADLSDANLFGAYLIGAYLNNARLSGANLSNAYLNNARLSGANLSDAYLNNANLSGANLNGAYLEKAQLERTVFGNVDLTGVIGLEQCIHRGPSTIDHLTLQKSGPLPLAFLHGVGLPDNLIEYLPSLLNQPIQHYSCFISYSSKDDEFANRIHADLQNSGVRCWFAPHDLPIGDRILDALDAAIRLREKVVLILSEHSIKSDWVEDEVTTGFEEERTRGQIVLFPVRLDEAVMNTNEAWAAKLRARNIGDFRKWKDHDAYKQSLARVLRDLTKPKAQ